MWICNASIMFLNNKKKLKVIEKAIKDGYSTHDLPRVEDLRYVKMNEMISKIFKLITWNVSYKAVVKDEKRQKDIPNLNSLQNKIFTLETEQ